LTADRSEDPVSAFEVLRLRAFGLDAAGHDAAGAPA
jgi:hypothetical protein